MLQQDLTIGEITIPVWNDGHELWYPLNTIYKEFYGREGLTKKSRSKYEEYCRLIAITYNTLNSITTNETWCINEHGLKLWLKSIHPKRLNKSEQKKNHNLLCKYFGENTISELDDYVDSVDRNYLVESYNEYDLKLHDSINKSCGYCLCNECKIYYPIHELFYLKNPQNTKGYDTSKCIKCRVGNFKGKRKSDIVEHITDKSIKEFEKINNLINTYGFIPDIWYSRDSILKLFKELKYDYVITIENFSVENFNEICTVNKINKNSIISHISYFELTLEIFGIEFYTRPYLYTDRKYPVKLQNFEYQIDVFNNYISDSNMEIEDILNFNYGEHIEKSKLRFNPSKNEGCSNYLDFVVKYNNYKYPAYMYSTKSSRYWEVKQNRIDNMISLIDGMKLKNFDRLPLYLTKYTVKQISNTMYNVLRNKYDGNLFAWIDECYPDRFEELDFNVKILKNEFDSLEEMQIHEILKYKFGKDLIYNVGSGMTRFSVNNKYQPDWIVLRCKPIIVEYFGMYNEKYDDKSTLVKYYNEKMPVKIEHYETLSNYDKLYIYPYDLKNNFEGLYKKLEDYA